MKRVLLGLLISAPIFAMDDYYEPSKAMRGSAQVQAAREKENTERAIAASRVTHQAETQKRQEAEDIARATANSLKENHSPKHGLAATKPTQKSGFRWKKWLALSGAILGGAAAYWYFRDTINGYAANGYNHLKSLYTK